jgi:hypothetical protein
MEKNPISEFIIGKFGEKLFQKSQNFPNNKINIIFSRNKPIKINAIILDNDREFHLVINEKKTEIFHDCPRFLIHSEKEKKVCVHFIKTLLLINKKLSLEILNNFDDYKLTSEDFGSKKKSKNYLLLANSCFDSSNCVEGLSYLNKAIINQSECENIIDTYLKRALNNNLLLEFFEFLKSGCENDLSDYFTQFDYYIEKGFKKLLNFISMYSFFNLLNIIESLNVVLEFIDFSFIKDLSGRFEKLVYSSNLNESYFSIYFIKKNFEKLINLNPAYKHLIRKDHLELSKIKFLDYFCDEIENLAVIDKLKLMKRQFEIIDIPKEKFYNEYKGYKAEIKELEKKIYLKKFAFLKLLTEKYKIKITRGEFRKQRNTYIIKHDEENLKPVYSYIISHLGFYGPENQIIKSTDIGINYFIIKELFLDDLSTHPDIFYYKKQFWGDNEKDFKLNSVDGFSLFSENINYNYDIDLHYSNLNDVMIIEWDLANKPRQGSIVNAYGSQIIIPDQNNSLFHDLKPFDLCYCNKTPVKIEGNIIKTINVITKCSFKDAIKSISKGMTFIEGYYPLSLVKAVLDKDMSPFKANELAINNPNKSFVPKYKQFLKDFREFLFNFINHEKDYIFQELKSDTEKNANQIIILLNLNNELAGLNLQYSEIIDELFNENINMNEFKLKFLKKIKYTIKSLLEKRELGSTAIFDLIKMKHTPFFKFANQILNIRKEEFESSKIIKSIEEGKIVYDISKINKTYYGNKFLKILKLNLNEPLKIEKFKKFSNIASNLNLELNIDKIY